MKNRLSLFLVFISVILFQSKIFSQEINVGPVEIVSYGFDGVYPVGDKSFFITHYDKIAGATLKLTYNSNFQQAKTVSITHNDCGVMVIDGKLFVFENKTVNGALEMSAQEYGTDCLPVGEVKQLLSYETKNKETVKEKIIQSEDKEFFAVYYEIENGGTTQFSFRIFDKLFNQLNEGIVTSNFKNSYHRIFRNNFSPTGDLYLTVDPVQSGGLYVWKLENNDLNEIKINVDEKKVHDLLVMPNLDGTVGYYGIRELESAKALETFTGILDFSNHNMTVTNSYGLSEDFIEFVNEKRKLYYRIADVVKCKDNGTVLFFEQYFDCELDRIRNPVSNASCLSYFDIKVIKMAGSQLVWKQRLGHMNQYRYSGRYKKSFTTHSDEEKSVIYLNLSLNQKTNPLEAPFMFSTSDDNRAKLNNCIGKITIDLDNGEINREMLSSAVPKGWYFEYEYGVWDEYSNAFLLPFNSGIMNYRYGFFPF